MAHDYVVIFQHGATSVQYRVAARQEPSRVTAMALVHAVSGVQRNKKVKPILQHGPVPTTHECGAQHTVGQAHHIDR
jgi:hypothetical protein